MSEEKDCKCSCKNRSQFNCGGGIYGFGVIGALFYFLPQTTTFNTVLIAIFKSIFWPALFVFHLLKLWSL